MPNTPPPIIIEPPVSARAAVIWMHGLGANGHDFEGIVPLLPTEDRAIRLIFPTAPERPVAINGGMAMPAWYDISDVNLKNTDKQGIAESTQTVHQLIDAQVASAIAADKIVVAGFSQGGAMAIHAGLRYGEKLAGILALSCYLLAPENHHSEINQANQKTPIWMAHGIEDDVIPHQRAKSSADFLIAQSHALTFVDYPMAHEVTTPEIHALSLWLKNVLE